MTTDLKNPSLDLETPVDFVSFLERSVWALERASDRHGDDLTAVVREILVEMRRPSDQMIAAGNSEDRNGSCASAALHWQTMIDEALR